MSDPSVVIPSRWNSRKRRKAKATRMTLAKHSAISATWWTNTSTATRMQPTSTLLWIGRGE